MSHSFVAPFPATTSSSLRLERILAQVCVVRFPKTFNHSFNALLPDVRLVEDLAVEAEWVEHCPLATWG